MHTQSSKRLTGSLIDETWKRLELKQKDINGVIVVRALRQLIEDEIHEDFIEQIVSKTGLSKEVVNEAFERIPALKPPTINEEIHHKRNC